MSNTSAPGADSKLGQKPKTHPLLEHREGGSTARAVPWKKESRGQAAWGCKWHKNSHSFCKGSAQR